MCFLLIHITFIMTKQRCVIKWCANLKENNKQLTLLHFTASRYMYIHKSNVRVHALLSIMQIILNKIEFK